MGSRVLDNVQIDQFLPAANASAVADRVWAERDIWNAPQMQRDQMTAAMADASAMNSEAEERAHDGAVLRGVSVAIGIEALTVLLLYGGWRYWQMLR